MKTDKKPNACEILFQIANTIRLFDPNDELMTKFAYDLLTLPSLMIYGFLQKIEKHLSLFNKSKAILNIFYAYLKYLRNKISTKPSFSWRMPNAVIPEHPKVELFLRSELTRMIYGGQFRSVIDGRFFAATYGSQRHIHSFSVDIQVKGTGSNTLVEIVKNQSHFNQTLSTFSKNVIECNRFLELIKKFQV